jgi:hypothetical protein
MLADQQRLRPRFQAKANLLLAGYAVRGLSRGDLLICRHCQLYCSRLVRLAAAISSLGESELSGWHLLQIWSVLDPLHRSVARPSLRRGWCRARSKPTYGDGQIRRENGQEEQNVNGRSARGKTREKLNPRPETPRARPRLFRNCRTRLARSLAMTCVALHALTDPALLPIPSGSLPCQDLSTVWLHEALLAAVQKRRHPVFSTKNGTFARFAGDPGSSSAGSTIERQMVPIGAKIYLSPKKSFYP